MFKYHFHIFISYFHEVFSIANYGDEYKHSMYEIYEPMSINYTTIMATVFYINIIQTTLKLFAKSCKSHRISVCEAMTLIGLSKNMKNEYRVFFTKP